MPRADGIDNVCVELVVRPKQGNIIQLRVNIRKQHGGRLCLYRGHAGAVVQEVAFVLMFRDACLGPKIILPRPVEVQMVLKQVKENRDMGRIFAVVQLVAGELKNNDGILVDLVVIVKAGRSDISHQKRFSGSAGSAGRTGRASGKNRVKHGGRCAFAFRPRDAYGLLPEPGEKKLRLRGDLVVLDAGVDPRALDHDIAGIKIDVLSGALEY